MILKILILESLGHIRCKDGNGMGRLDDDIKLVWGHIFPNCKLMGSRWEEDLMLSIIWERYENTFPIPIPQQCNMSFIFLIYGNYMGYLHCAIP